MSSEQRVPAQPRVAVTVDLEEYFQVQVMHGVVRMEDWDHLPSRIEPQTERLLELFADAGARGTFFVVGWVAERFPALIRNIAAAGHELACHSYWHRRVCELTPQEFREDTRRAKRAVEDAAGCAVYGYRAPNFSIPLDLDWAWDVLRESGFGYDSSLHPIRHFAYGAAAAPRTPFRLERQGLWELPMATTMLWGQRLPMAGGAYWRLAPTAYIHRGLMRAQRELGRAIAYLHPWELDTEQPRLPLTSVQRVRHYAGQQGMAAKLAHVLRCFGSRPIAELYAAELAPAGVAA